jgi:hypothetical protein
MGSERRVETNEGRGLTYYSLDVTAGSNVTRFTSDPSRIDHQRAPSFVGVYSAHIRQTQRGSAKLLYCLALPRGIEPLFQP